MFRGGVYGILLLFFILLCPDFALSLDAAYLISLSKHRTIVRDHIRRYPWRHDSLWAAAAEFHEYRAYSGCQVPPGDELWAVVGGLELSRQGSLRPALLHFGPSFNTRIQLCNKYLDAMDGTTEMEKVVAESGMTSYSRTPIATRPAPQDSVTRH